MKQQLAVVHKERKHSKYSASGAERWTNCYGSVALSEGLPDKDTPWSLEGTKAHEVLEEVLNAAVSFGGTSVGHARFDKSVPREMQAHAINAANFILGIREKHPGSELLVETRVHLPFIHPEMFGTFDSAVIDHFGTLHVFDYKYGVTLVSPVNNLQMIFYGVALAYLYNWNFKKVRFWIIQPRVKGYDGPLFWDLPILVLKNEIREFKWAVEQIEKQPNKLKEGPWCHWCKAKGICPLKTDKRNEQAALVFSSLKPQP